MSRRAERHRSEIRTVLPARTGMAGESWSQATRLSPGMVGRRHPVRLVEARRRHVDLGRQRVVLEGQLACRNPGRSGGSPCRSSGRRPGSPAVKRNSARPTLNQATAGAPAALRQSAQWHRASRGRACLAPRSAPCRRSSRRSVPLSAVIAWRVTMRSASSITGPVWLVKAMAEQGSAAGRRRDPVLAGIVDRDVAVALDGEPARSGKTA